jgi:hypothetical protein
MFNFTSYIYSGHSNDNSVMEINREKLSKEISIYIFRDGSMQEGYDCGDFVGHW